MVRIFTYGIFAAFAMLLSSHAGAQLTVPPIVTAGGTAKVNYTNAAKAGQTITVTIDSGNGNEHSTLQITVDATGKGSADWSVPNSPNWPSADFNAPEVGQASTLIVPPSGTGETAPLVTGAPVLGAPAVTGVAAPAS